MNNKVIAIIFLAICLIVGIMSDRVEAQSKDIMFSADQISLIKANCKSAKDTLTQLHTNDALLRVNRGQIYESLLTKLMQRFNNRLSTNNMINTNLVSVTQDYESSLKLFREDYIKYDEELTKLVKINCVNNPEEFYSKTQEVRTLRRIVNSRVVRLNQLIDQYTNDFTILKVNILSSLNLPGTNQ